MNYDKIQFSFTSTISESEYEERMESRAERIYATFVQSVLEEFDGREVFQPNEVQDEMRPPYSYKEVKNALQYGAENSEGLQLLEKDMDLYLLE